MFYRIDVLNNLRKSKKKQQLLPSCLLHKGLHDSCFSCNFFEMSTGRLDIIIVITIIVFLI